MQDKILDDVSLVHADSKGQRRASQVDDSVGVLVRVEEGSWWLGKG